MDNSYPSTRSTDAPATPFWLLIIRGVQALFALLVLALVATATSYFYADGYGMGIFTFIWTLIFLVYIFLGPRIFPQLYLFWAHVAFEATVWLFWLVTWALLADYVRAWNAIGSWWGGPGRAGTAIDCTRAAFAFALLNWFLFCFTLVMTVLLSRGTHSSATVDGTHHTSGAGPHTGGGFSFKNLFSSKKTANTDVEKEVAGNGVHNNGAVNETGQPVEMQNGVGHGATNGGYTNGNTANAGYENTNVVGGGNAEYPQQTTTGPAGQNYQTPGWEQPR